MANLNQGTLVSFNANSGQATYQFNVHQVSPDVIDYVNQHIEWYQQQGRRPFAEVSPDGLSFKHKTVDCATDLCTIEIRKSAKGSYAVFNGLLTQTERILLQSSKKPAQPFKGLKPLNSAPGVLSVATQQSEQSAEQTDQPAEQEVSSADADLAGSEPEAFE